LFAPTLVQIHIDFNKHFCYNCTYASARRKNMKPLYQKMYATLVGRVDATVEFMEESMLRGQCDWNTMGQAAKRLREALLETEEIFMSEDE
jgi:hypothetical protein